MSSRKCKQCGEFFSIKMTHCPECNSEYQATAQTHRRVPTQAERDAWPNPQTRPMPAPCINQVCEEIRAAYARTPHGALSTNPLVIKHRS